MELPEIGFGCSPYRGDGVVVDLSQVVEYALEVGYRLFDLAELYGNEGKVGEKLRGAKAPVREELYVVSKVWNTNHSYKHVIDACQRTVAQLGLGYVDLYLIHSPQAWRYTGPLDFPAEGSLEQYFDLAFPKDERALIDAVDIPIVETWRAMEELFSRGLSKAIGLSNFTVNQISQVVALAEISPTVVQVEINPYRKSQEVMSYCLDQGIKVMASSPLSAPGLLDDPLVRSLATKYGKSAAQIILRWDTQIDVIPIPSSTKKTHIATNFTISDFSLNEADLRVLDGLEEMRESASAVEEAAKGQGASGNDTFPKPAKIVIR